MESKEESTLTADREPALLKAEDDRNVVRTPSVPPMPEVPDASGLSAEGPRTTFFKHISDLVAEARSKGEKFCILTQRQLDEAMHKKLGYDGFVRYEMLVSARRWLETIEPTWYFEVRQRGLSNELLIDWRPETYSVTRPAAQ